MKRRGRLLISSTFLEIGLLIFMSFAIAFIWSDSVGVVSAADGDYWVGPDGVEGTEISGVIDFEDGKSKSVNEVKFNKEYRNYGSVDSGVVENSQYPHPSTTTVPAYAEGAKWGFKSDKGKVSAYNVGENEKIGTWDPTKREWKIEKGFEDIDKSKLTSAMTYSQTHGTDTGFEVFGEQLVEGIGWAITVVTIVGIVGSAAGLDSGETNAIIAGLSSGIIVGKAVYGILEANDMWNTKKTLGMTGNQMISAGVGIGVGAYVLYQTYKKDGEKIAAFSCNVWKPPKGKDDCEACNNNPWRPCTEYRCRSLGSTCEVVNSGTEEEKCVSIDPNDVNSPTIEPWYGVLKPDELQYSNVNLRPPSLGMKIVRGGEGCLKAYTPLQFGLTTNEPAYCKISYNRTKSFEEMPFDFGQTSFYLYNHTHKMLLPSPNDEDYELGPILQNDGTFTLFVRCEDKNGNSNEDEFAVNFCVDPSPDTTAPIIVDTSISSESPVQYGVGAVSVGVFVNEPAECKWTRESSKTYDEMENDLSCSTNPTQVNADLNYICLANLTGIKDMTENKYYFRCKDQPGKNDSSRNVMVESKELILWGSQPLYISEYGPNETISGNTDSVLVELTVKTDDGANEGEASCWFSENGANETYIQFFETGGFEHMQELELSGGNYNYYVRCVDAGGNADEKLTQFEVKVDREEPFVARAYKENGLKIVTSEDAECVYSISDCNYVFDEGITMEYSNPTIKTSHFAEWKAGATYNIKCRDEFGNEPSPNSCSLKISTFELS